MNNPNVNSSCHADGNAEFWRDDIVLKYDCQESLLSKKKEEDLASNIGIIIHLCREYGIRHPGNTELTPWISSTARTNYVFIGLDIDTICK